MSSEGLEERTEETVKRQNISGRLTVSSAGRLGIERSEIFLSKREAKSGRWSLLCGSEKELFWADIVGIDSLFNRQ